VDGTFVIESVTPPPPPIQQAQPLPVSTNDDSVAIPAEQRNDSIGMIVDKSKNNIKIWTAYEKVERKHWLCVSVVTNDVHKNADENNSRPFEKVFWLQNRYMLQDNNLTPWQSYSKVRGSIPERIQTHVHELISAVDSVCV
jgi:hypothetical protein